MLHLKQPEGSSYCGETCISMLTGVPLPQVVEICGKQNGTTTKDIIRTLSVFGINCAPRCRRISRKLPVYPQKCLLVLRNKTRKRFHWMLMLDNKIYDPEHMWPNGYDGWEITSYLEIYS